MFIQLKAMMSPLNGEKLQHAKDTVTVGRMGKAGATAKKPGAKERGTKPAAAKEPGAKERGDFRRYSSGALGVCVRADYPEQKISGHHQRTAGAGCACWLRRPACVVV